MCWSAAAAALKGLNNPPPPPGCVAELRGLQREDLNGVRGVLLPRPKAPGTASADSSSSEERWPVRLDDGKQLSIKAQNLEPVFEFQRLQGRGLGAIARFRMKAGDLILREPVALMGVVGKAPDRRSFKDLPAAQREAIMELHDAYAENKAPASLEGIIWTNGLPKAPRSDEVVVCPVASRFNHSCVPNAEYLWVEGQKVEEIRAVRDIAAGEEICVNYIGDTIREPFEARRAQIASAFRFDCCCEACRFSIEERKVSDERRTRLVQLGNDILGCQDKPERGLEMAEEMLELMASERISGPRTVAQVCNDGFQLSLLVGDDSEVQYWAHLSYEAHRHGWGEDYPLTKEMKQYSQNPPRLANRPASTAASRPKRERERERERGAAPLPFSTSPAAAAAAPHAATAAAPAATSKEKKIIAPEKDPGRAVAIAAPAAPSDPWLDELE
mmetsp:Transcript_14331/g.31701  ORF Transcript_14331/g.31701 Transcript_14331/m.31701 type:complete len:444 (-) Transcript_14331:11-1342(-)